MSSFTPGPTGHDAVRRIDRRRWLVVAAVVAVVAIAVALVITDPFAGTNAANDGAADNAYPTATATVSEQSLTSQTQVSATLGYAGSYAIAIPSGTPAATLTADRAGVVADEEKVDLDATALAAARAQAGPDDASTLLVAQTAVASDKSALSAARRQLTADRHLGCPASSSATVTGASTTSSASADSGGGGTSDPGTSATSGASGTPTASTTATTTPTGNTGSESAKAVIAAAGNSGSAPTTTTTTQPPTAPLAVTGAVDQTTNTSSVLTGEVEPNGADTHYYFEYGTSADFGQTTAAIDAGTSFTPAAVTVTLGGLLPGQTYDYRLVATNSVGTSYGEAATFATTAAPLAVTGTAASASATSETLSGSVDPGGLETSYYFEYGRTHALGRSTPVTQAGAGNGADPVSAIALKLRADTSYDFRIVATNALGTSVGVIENFESAASSCVAQATVVGEDAQALRTATDSLALDRLDAGAGVAGDETTLSDDDQSLNAAKQALALDETQSVNANSTLTSLPNAGQIIHRGQPVYDLNDVPVPLFYGTVTPDRALYLGVGDGPDVTQLQANLISLGFGANLSESPHFSAATAAAVRAWQASLGAPPTGIVRLGDFVLAPGPIEASKISATTGEAATAGLSVISATSTSPTVTIDLDAAEQSEVKVGDPVTITLPDNATTPGVVSSIGSVATAASSSGNTGSGGSSATITVQVTPSDPKATGGLDQAPVEVSITTASVTNALVVPVDALLALASGGYALEEIGTGGVHHLVGVSLGLFDDAAGLVQVTGSGVAVGQRVVVPNT